MARFVRRNWGWYFVLLDRPHFKVKLLRFKKDKSLSLQYHNHRNELWLWLSGAGSFHGGNDTVRARSGDAVRVGIGERHRYFCWVDSWIIEVQYGEKCCESDIVRL